MRDLRFGAGATLELAGSVAGDPLAPPVVMLHGGGQTRHSWKNGQAALAAAGHYVVSYDARGHGQSDWDPGGDYGADALVGDLRSVVATLAQPPVLIGASLGGLTALLAAGESDGPFARALVLVDVSPVLDNQGTRRVIEFMSANAAGFQTLEEVADAIGRYNPARRRPADLSGLKRNLREIDGRYYWHWDPRFVDPAQKKFPRERLDAAARKIEVPSMLLRGAESDLVGLAEMHALRATMQTIEVVEIANAGHMIAGDRNDAFNSAVLDFIGRLGLRRGPDPAASARP